MSDIDLYQKSPDHYDSLQNKRPDYVGANVSFLKLALKYLKEKKDVVIADFCCGVGKNSKQLAENLSVKSAILVDINGEFLRIAKESGIKAELIVEESDILKAKFPPHKADVVISMFAYHHVEDKDKILYIRKAKDALKSGGLFVLGEIYSPDSDTTLSYYKHLILSIPQIDRSKELENFLMQTAQSDDFEFKVPKNFADKQLTESGFELLESDKIWPKDKTFAPDIGTFVEVWQLKN